MCIRDSLYTGRTHQIRVHLASVGHPVVGDDTYGGGGGRRLVALPARRHFLHAAWLRFRHPGTIAHSRRPRIHRNTLGSANTSTEAADAPDESTRRRLLVAVAGRAYG